MKSINQIRISLENKKPRSAWDKGVILYAYELLAELEVNRRYENADMNVHPLEVEHDLLNGASNWYQYSWGGSSFVYDSDIAERLCTPSELKKARNGERRPNRNEEWLDVQARALNQACCLIKRLARF